MTVRAAALIAIAAVSLGAAVSLAACTASSTPTGPSTATTPDAAPRSSGPELTDIPPIRASPTTTPTTPTSRAPSTSSGTPSTSSGPSASSSAPSTSNSPVPAQSTCTKLTIRVLLGSGAPGYEFAALQFVNDGSTACTLVGVPTVTLLRRGAVTGTVSHPNRDHARFHEYRLAPGAVAESRLKDFSACNAPLSQSIRVVAPGSSIRTTRPGQLRACRLVVYPLGAPE